MFKILVRTEGSVKLRFAKGKLRGTSIVFPDADTAVPYLVLLQGQFPEARLQPTTKPPHLKSHSHIDEDLLMCAGVA